MFITMTAAYAEDATSVQRKQEMAKHSKVPVDAARVTELQSGYPVTTETTEVVGVCCAKDKIDGDRLESGKNGDETAMEEREEFCGFSPEEVENARRKAPMVNHEILGNPRESKRTQGFEVDEETRVVVPEAERNAGKLVDSIVVETEVDGSSEEIEDYGPDDSGTTRPEEKNRSHKDKRVLERVCHDAATSLRSHSKTDNSPKNTSGMNERPRDFFHATANSVEQSTNIHSINTNFVEHSSNVYLVNSNSMEHYECLHPVNTNPTAHSKSVRPVNLHSMEHSTNIQHINKPLTDKQEEEKENQDDKNCSINLYDVSVALEECVNNDLDVNVHQVDVSSNCVNVAAKDFPDANPMFDDEDDADYDPECEITFHEAVRAGDAKSVATLVNRGVVQNLDEPDWNVSGDPPLLVAATNHCLPVLRTLLESGCDSAVRSPRGETALHRAITNGGPTNILHFVEELLKHKCPLAVKEAGSGSTALHVLTRQLAHSQSSKSLHHKFEEALKTLDLLAVAGPVNAKDHQGRSALHILASSSIFDNNHKMEIQPMIQTLLNAGADPSLKNDRGETPLHEALECGALNTALLLMPYTPLGITSRYGETPLHIAARKNQTDVVRSLLERGEDPGLQDAGGNTPLHLASSRGFHHTVSLLVASPLAQLEKTNDDGLTSLQVAAESGFVNAVRLLLKAGADPSQTAQYFTTTLHHRHPDISVLIDHELTRRRQLAA